MLKKIIKNWLGITKIEDKLWPEENLYLGREWSGTDDLWPEPKGKVTHTQKAEYNPDAPKTGGRVVKLMPRQLKKIKEAQEKTEE